MGAVVDWNAVGDWFAVSFAVAFVITFVVVVIRTRKD